MLIVSTSNRVKTFIWYANIYLEEQPVWDIIVWQYIFSSDNDCAKNFIETHSWFNQLIFHGLKVYFLKCFQVTTILVFFLIFIRTSWRAQLIYYFFIKKTFFILGGACLICYMITVFKMFAFMWCVLWFKFTHMLLQTFQFIF